MEDKIKYLEATRSRLKSEIMNAIYDGINPPSDYANPDWESSGKVHEWKNYISENLRRMWHSFTDEQKAAIAESADDSASAEHWD